MSAREDFDLIERLIQGLGVEYVRDSIAIKVTATLTFKDWEAIQRLRERRPCKNCNGEGVVPVDDNCVCLVCFGFGRRRERSHGG